MDARRKTATAVAQAAGTASGSGAATGVVYDSLFEALCQTSPDCVVVVAPDGSIVFANQRCRELLGYEPQALIGLKVEELVPNHVRDHVQSRAGFHARPSTRQMGTRPILSAKHKSGVSIPVDISLSPLTLADAAGAAGERLVQAVIRDAAPRWKGQQEHLIQSVAMDCAANGIVITDTQGVIQWVNPAVSRMTGYASRELVGEHTRILKSGEHDPAFYEDLWTTISAGKTWHGEITNIRKDGSMYREEQHISPVHGDDDAITHYIAIKQDVTARRAAEREALDAHAELALKLKEIEDLHQQLREEAIRDPLTGLFNRRYMVETMAREMSRARREHINLAVLAIDLDHFKDVNDTLGHAAGDEVLVLLADILQGTIRQSDIACRLGGDEFLMVMPQMPLAMAEKRAGAWQTLFQERQRALRGSDRGPICTLSIGVAAIRADERSVDALLKRADDALYAAKRQGRSCAVTVE